MISRDHATITRLPDGRFMLHDHSLTGTYLNYTRVYGCDILNQEDIICFGHPYGTGVLPGQTVDAFYSDLKYRVRIAFCDVTGTSTAAVV
ncbi:Forkhead associated [Echinococcus multilocularis]|uniref:Forkhead associated n=1 Tax=Echinococcus multilocularis TaxID=6211 RepID=A0A068Y3Y0_ECHMU|nr:Forkhead associated [Echinococcus multilocularis]